MAKSIIGGGVGVGVPEGGFRGVGGWEGVPGEG